VDRTNNSREAITYQVECNVYYKDHIERMRIDMCNVKPEIYSGLKLTKISQIYTPRSRTKIESPAR